MYQQARGEFERAGAIRSTTVVTQDGTAADASSSRLSEAALSQPLSTAMQILLVDILFAASIRFKAIVGHSSGKIAATYAAGFICAHDATRIACCRGLHSRLAAGKDGVKGVMIAVATSRADA